MYRASWFETRSFAALLTMRRKRNGRALGPAMMLLRCAVPDTAGLYQRH